MTAAVLHDAEVASRFDQARERFKREVDPGDYRLRAVLCGLAGLASPLLLDLGCGKGRFARRLKAAGARVVGLDLSMGMLGEAEDLARVRGSARALPFADATFDAVVAVEAFEHMGNVGDAVAEARRVLRPGGRLIVVDKNAASLNARRPWLPSLVVKRIDERRGLWMYPADGPVRERWFWTHRLGRMLSGHFADVSIDYLLSPAESGRAVFRLLPTARLMACWTAREPGGDR
jgi:2-polyprenyl-6-hydroxyphenyl methylase/3-demethylubiquinone-9 3-methyltransferase